MNQTNETGILNDLARTIAERRAVSSEKSYTQSLLAGGPSKCAKKFGEEAVEFAIAVASEDRDGVTAEAADVLYHLLVALEVRDVPLDGVLAVLESRMGRSGHDEKAARTVANVAGG
ncbi:MAG: phosphoribosyl-ATP diphosphatase [Pseudomonadota bacterium]